jgi:L-threonylcarbamoyladenylate synthase
MLETEVLDATHETGVGRRLSVTRAAALLKSGQLVAFPTDTVYGLGAVASDRNAVAQLYAAKDRPAEKGIPILIANAQDIQLVAARVSDLVRRIAAHFWPGGLTLILPKSTKVPRTVSQSANVAVRLPALRLTRDIITGVGEPLAVTSANRSGGPSAITALEVGAQLGGRIAAILDGGRCPGGVASTVLDCTVIPPRILREGAVPAEALRRFSTLG